MVLDRPNWLLDDFSIEMVAKDISVLNAARPLLPAGTVVSITALPTETVPARIEAAAAVRRLGLSPVPHLSARRLGSEAQLDGCLGALRERAAVDQVFVIAGDPERAEGPYEDSLAVIRSGLLQRHGVRLVGIAGHPGGHGQVPEPLLWRALEDKARALRELGLAGEIVTQFAFDADPVLSWLERLREQAIDLPVRIGLPGPAGIATLLRFASRCGVEASAKALAGYGISLGRLLGSAGPERLVQTLQERLDPRLHGTVRAHFYPFGGLQRTARWIHAHAGHVAAAAVTPEILSPRPS